MKDISNPEVSPESSRFERFVAMDNGQFWRAKEDGERIKAGQVLMIQQIDDVDNAPHTIHVRLHPSEISSFTETVKFLVQDFLAKFEHVEKSEADTIRENEVLAIQGRVKKEQEEMQKAYTDTALLDALVDKEMPRKVEASEAKLPVKLETFGADIVGAVKTQNLTALMSKGLTQQGVEQIKSGLEEQKDIAVRRSEWILMRTKRLTQISSEITPFFQEKAALALAMTKDMRDHVDDLMKGIGNLNLYVLKDVEIEQLSKGMSAPSDLPLSIAQQVLYMDEELAVWEDVDDQFDCNNRNKFFDAVGKHSSLVNQLFPNERSVISIATTRSSKNYEERGYDPRTAALMRKENLLQFLLVRDGDNVYAVLSPDLFHQYSKTLFPTTSETEGVFTGFDGTKIKYSDLDYTRALKGHERIALGYKRMLILLCGLDHNKQLFGNFYDGEPSLEFVSLGFQKKYFRFIHDVDGDGALPSYRPQSVFDWVKELNSEISGGSRVIFQWRSIFNADSIPSAFQRENRWNYGESRSLQYMPVTELPTIHGVLRSREQELYLDVKVSGETIKYEEREFTATLNFTKGLRDAGSMDVLCLDRLNPKDARWYLHDRRSRSLNVSGIRMIKSALQLVELERITEKPLRDKLAEAIDSSNLFDDKEQSERLIDHAIAKWRCAHPKKEIVSLVDSPKEFNSLCDQIFFLGGKGRDPKDEIIENEAGIGRNVLRLSLLPNGSYVAYSTPLSNERDDRLQTFAWVVKTPYSLLKIGVRANKSTFCLLNKNNNAETIVFESNDVSEFFVPKNTPFKTPVEKDKRIQEVVDDAGLYGEIASIKGDIDKVSDLIDQYCSAKERLTMRGNNRYVVEPYTNFVIGMCVNKGRPFKVSFTLKSQSLLAWLCSGDEVLESKYVIACAKQYEDKKSMMSKSRSLLVQVKGKELHEVTNFYASEVKTRAKLFGEHVENYLNFDKAEGYEFSLSKRIALAKSQGMDFFFPSQYSEDLDVHMGIVAPADHLPLYVRGSGDFADKKVDVFPFSSEVKSAFNYSLGVCTSLEEIRKKYENYKYSSGTSSIKEMDDVTLKWKLVEPREVRGVKALYSYDYVEVSRVKRKM